MKGRGGDYHLLVTYCVLGPLPCILCKSMIFFNPHNTHQEANIIAPDLPIS